MLTAPPLLESPEEEAALGLEFYASFSPGVGGRLKEEPEDFVVVERTKWPREDAKGPVAVLQVRARNWETNRLVGKVARCVHLSRSQVGFAGTKDKRAVTTQALTVRTRATPEDVARAVRLPDLEVLRAYRGARALGLGDLEGNTFEIVVTHLDSSDGADTRVLAILEEAVRARGGVPNYFGPQRFGSLRPVTHVVGAAIIERDYRRAVESYIGTPSAFESKESADVRRGFREGADPRELLRVFGERLSFERTMLEHLAKDPDDYLGALLSLPRNLVLMFVHAYQSGIFNRVLSERMKRGLRLDRPEVGDLVVPLAQGQSALEDQPAEVTVENLPKVTRQVELRRAAVTAVVPGADVALAKGEIGEIERAVLERARRKSSDFVLEDMPRYTTTGVRRPIALLYDPLHAVGAEVRGERALRLSFDLPRGTYATVLLREVTKRPESAFVARATLPAPDEELA